jgi:hypothetical protein
MDEWWKQVHDEFTAHLEPRVNDHLWMNVLDPEEFFGIVGFRPYANVPLLRGVDTDWALSDTLYRAGSAEDANGNGSDPVRRVYAFADYGYLYLRLDLDTTSAVEWSRSAIRVALNALPGRAGSTVLPELGIRTPSGVTFLLEVDALSDARLLVAQNYDPWQTQVPLGRPDMTRLDRRIGMQLALGEATFGELTVEVNQPRWARDGREYPPIRLGHATLPLGTADPEEEGYSSRALWHVDARRGVLEFRLPWLMLLITDPVARLAFAGTDSVRVPLATSTEGVAVSVFTYSMGDADTTSVSPLQLIGSLPAVSSRVAGEPRVYRWGAWERVRYRAYPKPAYYALQSLWRGWPRYME